MLLSAVYVLVVAQSSSEVPEGLMNNPVSAIHDETSDLTAVRNGVDTVLIYCSAKPFIFVVLQIELSEWWLVRPLSNKECVLILY